MLVKSVKAQNFRLSSVCSSGIEAGYTGVMASFRHWVDWRTFANRELTARALGAFRYWGDRESERWRRWRDEGLRRATVWGDDRQLRCSVRADRRFGAIANRNRPRSAYFRAWLTAWISSVGYWCATSASHLWFSIVASSALTVVALARFTFASFIYIVRVVCALLLFVARRLSEVWDLTRCSILGAFWRRRRRPQVIKHVFVLMMENRSFDHMLGFADLQGTDAVTGEPTRVDDLVGKQHFNTHPEDPMTQVFARNPAETQFRAPFPCPGHEFRDTLMQLCGHHAEYPDPKTGKYPSINNSGFVASYHAIGAPDPVKIMGCFSPEQVPVLTTLAREFAVCDRWFSSMPGPTWPNRFFIHAASSGGLDDTPTHFEIAAATMLDGYHFQRGTIFDRLDERCMDWLVFMGDQMPQVFAIGGMSAARLQGHFVDFDNFEQFVNSPDFSTPYIFIEPNYGNVLPTTRGDFTGGNSQHPLDDIVPGELLIKKVYETIRNSPHWNESVLLVTYDEHGGFFDHVTPPATVHPGDKIGDPDNNKNNFDFTQLGVRVPAVVISPYIARGTIDHTVYDHASLLATVEKLFGLKPLTRRDRLANQFTHLFSLTAPRTDAPTILPDPAVSTAERPAIAPAGPATPGADGMCEATPPDSEAIDATIRGFLNFSFLLDYKLAPTPARKAIARRFLTIKTRPEALKYMREVGARTHTRKRSWKRRKVATITRAKSTDIPNDGVS